MRSDTVHLVVMGTAGCGKTTIAALLAQWTGWPLAEADDFHSAANVAKMTAGIPLADEDRKPWLDAIATWIGSRQSAGESSVLTCSALKRAYRDRLRAAADRVIFVHPAGPKAVVAERMLNRGGHFMPVALLDSQYADLEPLEADEPGISLDLTLSPEEIAGLALSRLGLAPRRPDASGISIAASDAAAPEVSIRS